MDNKVYYLIVDDEVFKHGKLEGLIVNVTSFNLVTKFYGEKIDSEKKFWEYFDCHEGLYSSFDELLSIKDGASHNVLIVDEHYVTAYPDIQEAVNKYRKIMKLPEIE